MMYGDGPSILVNKNLSYTLCRLLYACIRSQPQCQVSFSDFPSHDVCQTTSVGEIPHPCLPYAVYSHQDLLDFFDDVVGVTRLELATTRPPDAYANQLRHTPIQSSMSFLSLLRRNAPCLSCCVMHGMRCIVGVTRLELATTRPPDAYANQLRHTPIFACPEPMSLRLLS